MVKPRASRSLSHTHTRRESENGTGRENGTSEGEGGWLNREKRVMGGNFHRSPSHLMPNNCKVNRVFFYIRFLFYFIILIFRSDSATFGLRFSFATLFFIVSVFG